MDPMYPGWTFSIEEVSLDVYEVTASNTDGRSISRKGRDPETLLAEAKSGTRGLKGWRHA